MPAIEGPERNEGRPHEIVLLHRSPVAGIKTAPGIISQGKKLTVVVPLFRIIIEMEGKVGILKLRPLAASSRVGIPGVGIPLRIRLLAHDPPQGILLRQIPVDVEFGVANLNVITRNGCEALDIVGARLLAREILGAIGGNIAGVKDERLTSLGLAEVIRNLIDEDEITGGQVALKDRIAFFKVRGFSFFLSIEGPCDRFNLSGLVQGTADDNGAPVFKDDLGS